MKLSGNDFARAWVGSLKPRVNVAAMSAEDFLRSPDFCDVPITKAQRCLTRLAEGLPQDLDPLDMVYHLGASEWPTELVRPRIVVVESGRRSGKSVIAGLLGGVRPALTLPLRRVPDPGVEPERDGMIGPGQATDVRVLFCAPRVAQAKNGFKEVLAKCTKSPELSRHLTHVTSTGFFIQRNDGARVRFGVVAAQPAGKALRSGWNVGIIIDEADFIGHQDAAVNLEEQIQAALPSLIPGGQIWVVSSPWDESGQFHEKKVRAFGKPGATVFFHSSTTKMNPTVSVEDIEEVRRYDPVFAAREYDAVPMASGSNAFFSEPAIMLACSLPLDSYPLAPNGAPHYAGSDPGLRKNSATIAIARLENNVAVLAYSHELIPPRKTREEEEQDAKNGVTPGLSPSQVFKFFAQKALEYHATHVEGDQYYAESAIENMPQVVSRDGRTVYYKTVVDNVTSTAELFTKFRGLMNEGKVRLPNDPKLIRQLKETKVKVGEHGTPKVMLPRIEGAHGDLLKAIVLAVVQVPVELHAPEPTRVQLPTNPFSGRTIHAVGGRSGRMV